MQLLMMRILMARFPVERVIRRRSHVATVRTEMVREIVVIHIKIGFSFFPFHGFTIHVPVNQNGQFAYKLLIIQQIADLRKLFDYFKNFALAAHHAFQQNFFCRFEIIDEVIK